MGHKDEIKVRANYYIRMCQPTPLIDDTQVTQNGSQVDSCCHCHLPAVYQVFNPQCNARI